MNKQCVMIAVASLALALGVSPVNVFAGGKHAGTVERKAVTNTSTETGGKPCVINLTAPKEKGHCELGPNDPPAKFVIKGWYVATNWPQIKNGIVMDYTHLDEFATRLKKAPVVYIIDMDLDTENPMIFWDAKPVANLILDNELDPEEGKSSTWPDAVDVSTHFPVYTKEELSTAMRAVQKWAKAWKKSH